MFDPKGEKAEWALVYDAAVGLPLDGVLSYNELDAVLARDFRANRSPVYRAQIELERENSRTLINEPTVGYRIAHAAEHEKLGRHHHRKSRRALRKAVRKFASADRSQLTTDERQRMDALEAHARQHADMIRRIDGRVAKVEKEVADVRKGQQETDALIKGLEGLLRSHGIQWSGVA